jgi:hypothetical protein
MVAARCWVCLLHRGAVLIRGLVRDVNGWRGNLLAAYGKAVGIGWVLTPPPLPF